MKVAIIGSAKIEDQEIVSKAKEIGELLGKQGHTILTGGGSGGPDIVARAALAAGGQAIAYCAGKDLTDHRKWYTLDLSDYSQLIFQEFYIGSELSTIDLYLRSLKYCFDADKAIVIGGRVGTMYEVTILAATAKDIFVLKDSGGITGETIKSFTQEGHKEISKIEFINSVKDLENLI